MVKFGPDSKYQGLFKKCYMEEGINGFSLFDENDCFVGFVRKEGFLVEGTYPYKDKITRMLRERGIDVYDYDAFYERQHAEELAEALYGEPKKEKV